MTASRIAWVVACLALLAAATTAQPKELKPGVWFVPGTKEHPRNAGWVELADHVLLIDAGHPWAAAHVVEAVRKQTDKPIRFVVETTSLARRPVSAVRTGATPLVPAERGGAGVSFTGRTTLADGKRNVVLIPLGRAMSRGDVAIWLPKGRVLFAGELFGRSIPRGRVHADHEGWARALERMVGLRPEVVIGGNGKPGNGERLQERTRNLRRVLDEIAEVTAPGAPLSAMTEFVAEDNPLRSLVERDPDFFIPPFAWRGDSRPWAALMLILSREEFGKAQPRRLIETYGLREGSSPTRASPEWTAPKKIVVRARTSDRARWLARVVVARDVSVVAAADERAALAEIADADGVIGFCSKAILEKGKKLRWVQVGSAGVDRYVNIPGMQERHEITLTNMQRIYGPEIAEHVFGMLLALTRGLAVSIPLQQKGVWGRSEISKRMPFVELRGKTLLVVGLGGIGTEVARLGHGLGMRVIATRNSRRSGPPFVEKVGLAGDLLAMTREADVVVNCTPLTPATTGMFDADYFAAMKPTAYFLNIGRGKSVGTAALVEALRLGRLAGAGLDVTDPEPLPADHPLWKTERVVITPHVSARSDLRLERVWKLYRENLRRFVAGEPLLNVVDKKRGY